MTTPRRLVSRTVAVLAGVWLAAATASSADAADAPLPTALQSAILAMFAVAESESGQCSAPAAVTETVSSQPDLAPAIAAFAARQMAAGGGSAGAADAGGGCACLGALAKGLASASPDQASAVGAAVDGEAPECGELVDDALEASLLAPSAGMRGPLAATPGMIHGGLGGGGGPAPKPAGAPTPPSQTPPLEPARTETASPHAY